MFRLSIQHRFLRWAGLDHLAIGSKLNLLALLSSALGLTLAAALLITYNARITRENTVRDLQILARIAAENSAAAVLFNDESAAAETLAALRVKPEVDSACLYRSAAGPDSLFASYARGPRDCPRAPGTDGLSEEGERLIAVTAVEHLSERAGTLRLTQDLNSLRQALNTQMLIALGVFLLSLVVSVGVARLLQRAITEPILRLAKTARKVAETRDFRLRVQAGGSDEVGFLIEDFNRMLSFIQAGQWDNQIAHEVLAEEMRKKTGTNENLERALQQLRDAQAQLVQSEKMASLGELVAGVAHEINTPVGVAVSAASTLREYAVRLQQQQERGLMTRTELNRFLSLADESSRLVLNNLERAAELIQSFKRVAVDQSSGERRRFALRDYLDEVTTSLMPELRKTRHRVEVSCPEELVVDSYPGALAQVVTNLVTNSLLHAYEQDQAGHIRIEAAPAADGEINLRYSDDGRGIPPEHHGKVFDPFFTTRRGEGGSGLGLHIVYNLVTQLLRGSIQLSSEANRGACFIIRFPAILRAEGT